MQSSIYKTQRVNYSIEKIIGYESEDDSEVEFDETKWIVVSKNNFLKLRKELRSVKSQLAWEIKKNEYVQSLIKEMTFLIDNQNI